MQQRATRLGLASFLFLISGLAALVYQVIWQRMLGIVSVKIIGPLSRERFLTTGDVNTDLFPRDEYARRY